MALTKVEWHVVCADGNEHVPSGLGLSEFVLDDEDRARAFAAGSINSHPCAPHRVQTRTVTIGDWMDC